MNTTRRSNKLLATAASTALVLAACGGSGDDEVSDEPEAEASDTGGDAEPEGDTGDEPDAEGDTGDEPEAEGDTGGDADHELAAEGGGTLIWEDGVAGVQTITVPISTDLVVEAEELFELRLAVPDEFADIARLGSPSTARVTILDSTIPPREAGTLQWAAASASIIETGGAVELSVTRVGGGDGRVGVAFATEDRKSVV